MRRQHTKAGTEDETNDHPDELEEAWQKVSREHIDIKDLNSISSGGGASNRSEHNQVDLEDIMKLSNKTQQTSSRPILNMEEAVCAGIGTVKMFIKSSMTVACS